MPRGDGIMAESQLRAEPVRGERADGKPLSLCSHYAGLKLRNPLISAAGPLTGSVSRIVQLAQAGIGGIVLHPLAEEGASQVAEYLLHDQSVGKHSEAWDYIREMGKMIQPDEYMDLLAEARRQPELREVPLIVSLSDPVRWRDYVFGLERAGASAIELSPSLLQSAPCRSRRDEQRAEKRLLRALGTCSAELSIPLTLKVPPHMSNDLLRRMAAAGVRGMVSHLSDIDLEHMELRPGPRIPQPAASHLPLLGPALRGLTLHTAPLRSGKGPFHPSAQHRNAQYARGCDLALSVGVHSAGQLIKALLVGASAVQLCSVLLQQGTAHIAVLLDELAQWMRGENILSLERLRARYRLPQNPRSLGP